MLYEKGKEEMMEKYSVRTDLALEEKERFASDNVEIQGVILEETYDEVKDLKVTTVRIETENGAKIMGKPVGTYITMEAPNLSLPDEEYHIEIAVELAGYLKEFINENEKDPTILIVGLGNRQVTPDALGPFVVDHLDITRHIVKEYGKYAMGKEKVVLTSAIAPGVMGQTGMETVEVIRGVVNEIHPEIVIVVDALAARSYKRLNRTIQIADTGIHPGSGVGNHRNSITKDTVGVPVIAVGVPTVVDAATIVNDSIENILKKIENAEKYEIMKELYASNLNGLFVTPKDIDEMVRRLSYTVAEALNMLFEMHHI